MSGQRQSERPQDEKPHQTPVPPVDQVHIEPVDDILRELENLKKKEQDKCGCWPSRDA
jgi:hypothetical protein